MADALGDHGYEVLEAGNGSEALEIAREHVPTLILLDLMMPSMDGWTFLRHRAEDAVLSAIPVIILTAQRESDWPAEAAVLHILSKPTEMTELIALIEQLHAGFGS